MRKKIIVRGFVQGVGYRTFVKIMARQYGLRGKVKNLDDGNVEIILDVKNKEILNEFIKRIDVKGELPFEPSVREIIVEDYEGEEELPLFEIDYGYEMSIAEREMIERSEVGIIAFGWMGRYLAGKMDKGFGEVGEKIDNVSEKVGKGFADLGNKIDKGVSDLGEKIDKVSEKIDEIGNKLEEHIGKTDTLIDKTEEFHSEMVSKFDYLDEKYGEFSNALNRIENDIREMKDAFIKLVDNLVDKRGEK